MKALLLVLAIIPMSAMAGMNFNAAKAKQISGETKARAANKEDALMKIRDEAYAGKTSTLFTGPCTNLNSLKSDGYKVSEVCISANDCQCTISWAE